MQIKEVPIDTIFPYPENPREIEDSQFEKLQKSIKEFGFVEPLVVNVREHSDFKPEEKVPTIVGGNMRFRAAKALGMKEVPIVEVNLDRTKEMALNIGLNRIAGRWDVGKLEKLVYDLSNTDLDIDLDLTGLEDWEQKLYNPGSEIDPEEIWKEMPEYKKAPFEVYKRIIVNFDNENDFNDFQKLINQKMTFNTKFIWFPFKEKQDIKSMKIISKNES